MYDKFEKDVFKNNFIMVAIPFQLYFSKILSIH